jgi:HlyD family secretion protein
MATRLSFCTSVIAVALGSGGCSPHNGNVLQGYAEGEFVRIAAPYAGTLLELKVQRGTQIRPNAPLFVLEQENEAAARLEAQKLLQRAEAQLENLKKGKRPSELAAIRAQRDQAHAAFTQSEADFRRNSKLASTGFISAEKLDVARAALARDKARIAELDAQLTTAQLSARSDEIKAAEADVAATRAALQQAEWKLAQKTVNAPVAGLVQDTLYVKGEWVPAGSPVISMLPPENIKIRFFVPEQQLAKVHAGQPVKITCDSCGAAVTASIIYISPQAEYTPPVIYSKENRDKLVYLIEAKTAPADAVKLHPGQPVDVAL